MLLPAITDYVNALENPLGIFRTLGEPRVVRDVWGRVELQAGNSAAIFRYDDGEGRPRFLKCYIRPNPHLRTIYEYVERRSPAILPRVRLLPDEMFVHAPGGDAGWVDIVEGEWTPGETLAAALARAVRATDGARLEELARAFDLLWAGIRATEWAHGDLKPENIIVRPAADAGARLTLIDCDAMWIPALAGRRAAESGTPPWRDPSRTAARFGKIIDNHPARLIASSLHALASRPALWPVYTGLEDLA